MHIEDTSIISTTWVPAHNSPTGSPLQEVIYDPFAPLRTNKAMKERKNTMWLEVEDAHSGLANLANANRIRMNYSHGDYHVYADFIGGGDCLLKTFNSEKEATDFVKDLYQQLL